MRNYGKYGEIKNPKIFGHEDHADGPVITYKLSPKELAKYQKYQKEGTANMGVKKEKIPAPPKEEMEKLIKQHHGSINAMSLAKGVSWQVVKNWLRELGFEDFANELKKLCNKKKTPSTATPAVEAPEPQATAPGPDNPSPPAIIGVGPDTPEHINEAGGRESDIPYRCDLLGARAILEIARILYNGAKKYKENNWRLISCRSHINHALTHIFAYLAGDTQDEHLEHALCRMMMAVETKDS